MAQKREIRAFADRGTWRFRTQDIEELSKRRGEGSAASGATAEGLAEDEPAPPATAARNPTRNIGKPPAVEEETFGFSLTPDDHVEIGQEILPDLSSSGKSGKKKKSSGVLAPQSPNAGDDFPLSLGDDETIRLADDVPAPPASSSGARKRSGIAPPDAGPPSSKSSSGRKTGIPTSSRQDTGVRLSPLPDEDNEVRLDFDSPAKSDDDSFVSVGDNLPQMPEDSNVRLSPMDEPPPITDDQPNPESFRTEEMIDLDAELRKADELSQKHKPSSKVKPSSGVKKSSGLKAQPPELPTSSPFELSEADLDVKSGGQPAAGLSGSEYDLAAPDLGGDMKLRDDDEDVELGALNFAGGDLSSGRAGQSGISLQSPADSGLAMDSGTGGSTEEVDFELTLDADNSLVGPRTGKGVAKTGVHAEAPSGEDSEFELTIDEDGEGAAISGLKGGAATEEEKDIFETDFELPALEEDSGSQAVALESPDTDLESSDFDLALDDADATAEDESGSAVVVLGEEPSSDEAGPPTITRKRGAGATAAADEDEGSFDDLLSQDDLGQVEAEAEEDEGEPVGAVAAGPAADWGFWGMFMLPCAIVMIVVGLMSYELLHSMWGYHKPHQSTGIVVRFFAGLFFDELPKE